LEGIIIIILCTHHKGGVGKTTLAVHLAGILQEEVGRTLLIDCDSQADSWFFFTRTFPNRNYTYADISNRLSVVWNPDRKPIGKFVDPEEYDNIVLDIDSPIETTVQVIVQDDPDVVIIPINKQDLAITHLSDSLDVISELSKRAGYNPKTIIIPLGSSVKAIREKIKSLNKIPNDYTIYKRMRNLFAITSSAINEGNFIWDYKDTEDIHQYFYDILTKAGGK